MRTISRAAIAVVAVLGLAACSTDDSTDATATTSPAPSVSSTDSTSASPSATVTPDTTEPTSEFVLPEGMVAGTDQATAYEALMSPIGEYAAAATYQAIIDKYGAVEPYVMILSAEERHISALVRQLDRLGVDVPANPYLGKVVAPTDLVTAANEEANIEVLNAAMYDSLISQSSDANLIRVFTNLQRASTDSHLPLFLAAAENGGTLTVEQMMDLQHG